LIFKLEKKYLPFCKPSFLNEEVNCTEAGLHCGDYRSKLVPFEEQKNIFYALKRLYLRAIIAIV
jgi:hypothetical protein